MNQAHRGGALRAAGRVFDLDELTPAERRVLELALEGRSVREITDALVLSEATVRSHLSRIYAKLGVRGRVELLARVAESRPDARDGATPSAPVASANTGSLAGILVALGAVVILTFVLPLVAVVTVPGLLVAGLLCLRAAPGSRERRAAPWVLLAAGIAALWALVAASAMVGFVSTSGEGSEPIPVPS